MTNSTLTSDNIAKTAAVLVGADLNLASRLHRDLEANFTAGSGSTVLIRVPGAIASQVRGIYDTTTPLVGGSINESSIAVTLTDHVYDSVALSDGDLDLDISDFAKQILLPQSRAIVAHVERAVATAFSATPETTTITYTAATPAKAFTKLRQTLRDNGVPTGSDLIAAVGSSVYSDLLDGPVGTFDDSGKVRGFEIIESTRLASDEIVAFTPDAFALVVRAPKVPEGSAFGTSISEGGFSLRHLRNFDSTVAADRSLVSAFVAVQALPLAVDLEDGTIELRPNAGAVRVLTAA